MDQKDRNRPSGEQNKKGMGKEGFKNNRVSGNKRKKEENFG